MLLICMTQCSLQVLIGIGQLFNESFPYPKYDKKVVYFHVLYCCHGNKMCYLIVIFFWGGGGEEEEGG